MRHDNLKDFMNDLNRVTNDVFTYYQESNLYTLKINGKSAVVIKGYKAFCDFLGSLFQTLLCMKKEGEK